MNTKLVWKVLFAILALAFLTFGLTALILNFAAQGMGTGTFTALTRFSSFAFFVSLFFAQIIALFFLLTVIGWAISKAVIYFWLQRHSDEDDAKEEPDQMAQKPDDSADANPMGQMPRLFSVVTASAVVALFFSNALRAVFDAIISITTYVFGTLPQTVLSEIDRIISCVTNETEGVSIVAGMPVLEGAPIRNCVAELVGNDQILVNNAVFSLTGADGQTAVDFPQIVLAFVVFAAVLRIVDMQARGATRVMKFWTAYSFIAAIAIYLSLSATLSVSLLLEKTLETSDLSGDVLVAQITDSRPAEPSYDFSALDETVPLDIIGDSTRMAILINSQQVDAITAKERARFNVSSSFFSHIITRTSPASGFSYLMC